MLLPGLQNVGYIIEDGKPYGLLLDFSAAATVCMPHPLMLVFVEQTAQGLGACKVCLLHGST